MVTCNLLYTSTAFLIVLLTIQLERTENMSTASEKHTKSCVNMNLIQYNLYIYLILLYFYFVLFLLFYYFIVFYFYRYINPVLCTELSLPDPVLKCALQKNLI